MQDLRVIGVENGALLVASDDGERYRIPIDEVLQSRLRQSTPDRGAGHRLSPREIQDQIRSGMSAEDVASVTGMPVEHIAKYEGPILAEREHVVLSALEVPVHTAMETGPFSGGMSFGIAIRSRLHAISAVNERWASWKDKTAGWVVKLSFTADTIDHDARWSFDPRRLTLSPLNGEATTLSQQGDVPTPLVPRLRAVSTADRQPDASRFDSGAFDHSASDLNDMRDSAQQTNRFAPKLQAHGDSHQTADLLDALRRRRGEREAAPTGDEDVSPSRPTAVHPSARQNSANQNSANQNSANHPSTGSIRTIDVPLPEFASPAQAADDDHEGQRATLPQPSAQAAAPAAKPSTGAKGRKGRMSMPSWDDIVFGARPDDH
jgi:hypothetical protein